MVAAKTPSLELLQIASPCSANWDDMVGDERARLCGQCNHKVFNLSDMSRDEALAFLAAREGRTCVRMYKRADGTVLTRDCPVGIAAVRAKFTRLVLATVGLVLALSATALAAFIKNPAVKGYLSHGKLNQLQQQMQPPIMGEICPPPLINPVPAPGVGVAPPIDAPLDAPLP